MAAQVKSSYTTALTVMRGSDLRARHVTCAGPAPSLGELVDTIFAGWHAGRRSLDLRLQLRQQSSWLSPALLLGMPQCKNTISLLSHSFLSAVLSGSRLSVQ